MARTATAERMMSSLPAYYDSEPIVERVAQAWANEIDRIDARLDQIKDGLVPSLASDTLGMLALWEAMLDLPVNPPDATVSQRSAKVNAALRKLDSSTAAGYLATLAAAINSDAWALLRDTPDVLEDTLQIPYAEDSYNAAQVQEVALRMHPAHRRLFLRYSTGFLLDLSRLDEDTL